jgi:hypothetical protein
VIEIMKVWVALEVEVLAVTITSWTLSLSESVGSSKSGAFGCMKDRAPVRGLISKEWPSAPPAIE